MARMSTSRGTGEDRDVAKHVQSLGPAAAPATEVKPAGHSAHSPPTMAEACCPAGHAQPELVLASVAHIGMQPALEVLPTESELVPVKHESHAAPPGSALYDPAGQARQASGGPK